MTDKTFASALEARQMKSIRLIWFFGGLAGVSDEIFTDCNAAPDVTTIILIVKRWK
jgi:hypothetical protein